MVLNNRPYPDWHEGLTIRGVMEHKVTLEEADDLKIYHLLGGG